MRHKLRLMFFCLASLALISFLSYWGLMHGNRSNPLDASDQKTEVSWDVPGANEIADPHASDHEPMETCKSCHESETPDETKARELAQQVPKLCYRCHEDESKAFAHVHGPVAVGQCLFCHDPHKSEHAHLLKHKPPQLCALCHTPADLASIEKHLESSHVDCLECHSSHASHERFLLKKGQS